MTRTIPTIADPGVATRAREKHRQANEAATIQSAAAATPLNRALALIEAAAALEKIAIGIRDAETVARLALAAMDRLTPRLRIPKERP